MVLLRFNDWLSCRTATEVITLALVLLRFKIATELSYCQVIVLILVLKPGSWGAAVVVPPPPPTPLGLRFTDGLMLQHSIFVNRKNIEVLDKTLKVNIQFKIWRSWLITDWSNCLSALKQFSRKIRPGSYVASLPGHVEIKLQRIKFDRNLTSESAAATVQDWPCCIIRTKMLHRFKRRIGLALSNFIHVLCSMYWAYVNFVPSKKKKLLGHFCLNATWTYCNTYWLTLPALYSSSRWCNWKKNQFLIQNLG